MKRQQSFQDTPSKRRCIQQQSAMRTQENQPPVSQWPSNSHQIWDRFPQQPVQQHDYYNRSNNICTDTFPQQGYSGSVNYAPLQHSPLQYTPMQYPPIEYNPAHFTSTQIVSDQVLPQQFTGLSTNLDMTLGGGYINNNILPQHATYMPNYQFDFSITTQNQPNVETIYPKLLERVGAPQPPSEPRPPFRGPVDMPGMPGMPTGIGAKCSTPIGLNIPNKVPMNLPEDYEFGSCLPTVRRKLSKSKDVYGVDLTAIGRPKPTLEKKEQYDNDLTTICQPKPTPEKEEQHDNDLKIHDLDQYEGLGLIKDWLDLDKQREITLEEEKKKKAKELEEAKDHAQALALDSHNNLSEYPAESYEHLRLPGCKFRAQAIRVGRPRREWLLSQDEARTKQRFSVFAVRQAGGNGIKFKLVEPGSTVQEVMKSQDIQFNDIQMNETFSDMKEMKVMQISKYLLDAVPGTTDSVTMWG